MNRYTFEEIQIGQEESFKAKLTAEKVEAFRQISGDENPLHIDTEYAKSKGYADKVVYGMLTASFLSTLAGMYLPGELSLIHSVEVKFVNPLILAEYENLEAELTISGIVTEKSDTFKRLTLKVGIADSLQRKILRGTIKVGVLDADQ